MIGVLWFDQDPKKPVSEKVKDAAKYYFDQFGQAATTCFVHPAQYSPVLDTPGIVVRATRSVMPNHFWAGRE